MKRNPYHFVLLAAAGVVLPLVASCAAHSNGANCQFIYTPAVQRELIIPELKKNFSGAYIYFDFEKPVIVNEPRRTIVQLSASKVVNGRTLAFEDLFFVEIDSCSRRVLRSYSTQQYHKE